MSPSPPPRGRKAKHCSHSPPHGRGGNGRSGGVSRGASPVANFDSSFSPRSISPEIKGKTELVVCFGELLIDFVPTVGGLSLADAPAFKKAPGGAPANVAVGIAKLGGNAAFVGKVGDDEFGYMLVEVLKENRVETKGCRFDPNARTALAFVTLREDGEREFMFYRNPSADMLFETKELDTEILKAVTDYRQDL
ncbi:hypothetical protein KC19_2G105800 [Ceratodon purpureus]|uniref:Carbohydrate kinase PfkB domain-containing protein n=1 Tax=Ceratodon purpureus TaxID=3225 RepID=A0A8T0IUI6_CERPU|nr:hypothetical protein KC19_2G105800 [Ceratodon purpureus]